MQTFEQARDVLEHARLLHEKLAAFYRHMEDEADKQRVQMLLDYLQGHEQRLQESLARYERGGAETVLNTWLQYVPEQAMPSLPESFRRDMSVDEVVRVALGYENYLIELYRGVAERADLPEAREVFKELLEKELQERREVAKNVLRLDEL